MTDTSAADRLQRYVEEFRANAGRLGGNFEGVPVVLPYDLDAVTGDERVTPLTCQPLKRAWAIFASSGGSPTDPAWYRNLLAYPDVTIEFGADNIEVIARVAEGAERDAIWTRQKQLMPAFGGYEQTAGRTIPVVILEPR